MSQITTLIFTPDNPSNSVLTYLDTGDVAYTIVTSHTDKASTTRLKNCDGEVVASSEWRDIRSDMITLGSSSRPFSSSMWLKKSMVPFKDTVYFSDPSTQKKYKWKGNGPGLQFELYAEDDKANCMARFSKATKTLDKSTSPPGRIPVAARLVLDARAEAIMDIVVLSFIILEKGRRARENSTMNHADVDAMPLQVVGKSYAMVNGGS